MCIHRATKQSWNRNYEKYFSFHFHFQNCTHGKWRNDLTLCNFSIMIMYKRSYNNNKYNNFFLAPFPLCMSTYTQRTNRTRWDISACLCISSWNSERRSFQFVIITVHFFHIVRFMGEEIFHTFRQSHRQANSYSRGWEFIFFLHNFFQIEFSSGISWWFLNTWETLGRNYV